MHVNLQSPGVIWQPWPEPQTPAAAFWSNPDAVDQIRNSKPREPVFGAFGHRDGPFLNHDCLDVPNPILDWNGLRESLRTECGHSRETRSLQCSARVTNWEDRVLPYLRLQGIGSPESMLSKFDLFSKKHAAAYAECPLGVLILNIAITMLCARMSHVEYYLRYTSWISKELYAIPLAVIIGTEWPIFALLNSYEWDWPGIPPGRDYDCKNNQTWVNWDAFAQSLSYDPAVPDGSWWMDSIKFVFDKSWAQSFYHASKECLYGVYVCNLVKAMWGADTESSSYKTYAEPTRYILYESVHLLGASRWPIFAIFHHLSSLRRHGFRLDFTARELGGLVYREEGAWLQSLPVDEHVALLEESVASERPQLVAAVRAFCLALQSAPPGLRVVYVTMVYGRMNRYIAGWSRRLKTLGVNNLVMLTLDDAANQLCTDHYGEKCIKASVNVLNKYTLLLVALQLGIDVVWLDFDIFLVRNPNAAVAQHAGSGETGYDVLMGYSYSSDCICNGFFYLRARPQTHRWLFEMVRWLYDHPFEHDQRALAAFLNYTERISAEPEDLPPPPRWHVFDVDNAFINWNGWEGRYEDLVLVHFVDGSAFSLYGRPSWDPSVSESTRKSLKGDESPDSFGPNVAPMQAFYMHPHACDAAPEELWEVAPELRHRLSQMILPKRARQKCGIMPSVKSSHSGYGWVAEAPKATMQHM